MSTLKKNYLVNKKNEMIGIRPNTMTLQEMRFFSIYLSKIHKDKPEKTRVVRFPMTEFRAIMELGRIDINYMKSVTDSLLCKIVNVPIEDEKGKSKGYNAFQLFKECTVSHDYGGEWYVEIDAHDKALPLMFGYKNKFTSYQVWNILRLRSPNQQKMYELLKQYENTKEKTVVVTVEELRERLGIEKNEYDDRWDNFKRRVLDACQKALAEYTDIKFTYEPHGKRGKGNKILSLKFHIEGNKDYTDQFTLDEYLEEKEKTKYGDTPKELIRLDENDEAPYEQKMAFLSGACNNEFSIKEIMVLHDLMVENLPYNLVSHQLDCYDYLAKKYRYMNMRDEKKPIPYRFSYMKSIIGSA